MPIRFNALIQRRGINPFCRSQFSSGGGSHAGLAQTAPFLVRMNDRPQVPWRINLMPAGNGDFYLYLHEIVRKASGTSVGDRVSVKLSFDANYRSGPPTSMQWFKQAFDLNPQAMKNWAALIPNRKKKTPLLVTIEVFGRSYQ
jgi:hypothetical protein